MKVESWIQAARKKADITQERLGELLGLTKANI
jgi:DNA-binding XRE family transcriptional regulator